MHPYVNAKQTPIERLSNTWFSQNQYFEAETGLRAGTYFDFSPIKKLFGLKVGEYKETSIKTGYSNNKSFITNNEGHFLEIGANCLYGGNIIYNLGKDRFESASVSAFTITFEFSMLPNNQPQIYFGVDTGSSIGIGIGGFGNIKGGWKFNP
jgi:hypothetical protein